MLESNGERGVAFFEHHGRLPHYLKKEKRRGHYANQQAEIQEQIETCV